MKVFLVAFVALVATVARTGAQTQAQLEATLQLLDANKNGYIEKEESGINKAGGQAGDIGWNLALQLGDANKDGKLSISEFAGYTLKAKNGGGGMGGPGGAGGPPPPPDANSDGFVSKEEMVTMMGADKVTDKCWKAMLEKADKNKDGKMSGPEFTEAVVGKEPEACSGASCVTTALSVFTLLALAVRLF